MTKFDREHDEIQMCLNCPLPDCVDCLGKLAPKDARKTVLRMQEVRRMAALGYTDKKMAAILKVQPLTIYKYRKEMGIPGLRERMAVAEGGVA